IVSRNNRIVSRNNRIVSRNNRITTLKDLYVPDFSRYLVRKAHKKPNPLTPNPWREGGKFKFSLLLREKNRSEVFQIL
ncbi:hypothetical protein, partial [uncultured Nostoc sp.]|uniref:hypothetical protein n=1 Tax=uncultured Nostoc sp. TaxID=340711 RepID=UPI0035CA8008